MKVSIWLRALHPRSVFRISRAARRETVNVFVCVERDGVAGWGEAAANAYYGECAEHVAARLEGMGRWIAAQPVESAEDIARLWAEAWPRLESRAAQCALDLALWDWLGRRRGRSVAALALGREAGPVESFATLGISDPEELEAKLGEMRGFPRVKVKVDRTGSLAAIERVRERMPEAMLAVDANCAWGSVDAAAMRRGLEAARVEFVEQPLEPVRDGEVAELGRRLGVPVMADESCVVEEDVERMPGVFAGFNIKLVKCGGLTPALRLARRGRELGLKTLVGCMLESSVGIAAGAVAAQHSDYADLDGAWLLGDDPARGWSFDQGVLRPPAGPGLGVEVAM